MFYDLSRDQQAIRQKMQACQQALVELEKRAGIAAAAENARTEPPNYFAIHDAAEPHSDKQRELEEFEEQMQQRRATRRLRALYFGVADIKLRKKLIAKDREKGDLGLSFWRAEVADASRRFGAAQSAGKYWWVLASVWAIGLVGLGFYFFGMVGALGGLIVGYFSGRSREQSALRARQSAIAEAERELKEAEQYWDKVRNEPQTFSQGEASSGEPDQDDRRAVAS